MDLNSFDIRYSELEDLDYLEKWFVDPSACLDFPFTFDMRESALRNWIGFSKFKASLTGILSGTPCAVGTLFLMPYKKVAHHCGVYLIVAPESRRNGIGEAMVRNLCHLARERFRLEAIHVELYEPSLCLPLLQKLDFQLIVRQERFVHVDGNFRARLLMEKQL
jgi:putative acetyltransferase